MQKDHTYNLIVDRLKTRLDRFIAEKVEGISRSKIQQDIEAGLVTANGKVMIAGKQVVRDGDKIVYHFKASKDLLPKNIPIHTLYDNHGLLIIEKPPGIAVHPGAGFTGDSLTQGLLFHFKDIAIVGEEDRPGIVHRLDKDTSGVMLVARTPEMYDYLKQVFADRKIKKEYIALIRGRIEPSHGVIELPIGKNKGDFRKYSTENMIEAKPSKTEYWVLEYLGGASGPKAKLAVDMSKKGLSGRPRLDSGVDEYTLIKVQLHTGRTHQIRVHFASLGHSILGDALYGTKKNSIKGLNRQFLHASSIELQLPTGESIEAESKLPQDLRSVLVKLKSKVVNKI